MGSFGIVESIPDRMFQLACIEPLFAKAPGRDLFNKLGKALLAVIGGFRLGGGILPGSPWNITKTGIFLDLA